MSRIRAVRATGVGALVVLSGLQVGGASFELDLSGAQLAGVFHPPEAPAGT